MIRGADRAALQGALVRRLGAVTAPDKTSLVFPMHRAAVNAQVARNDRCALSFCTLSFDLVPLWRGEVSERRGFPFADSNTTKVTQLLFSPSVFHASVCRNS